MFKTHVLYKIYFLIYNLDFVFGIILLKHSSDNHFRIKIMRGQLQCRPLHVVKVK